MHPLPFRSTAVSSTLAVLLAVGWGLREAQFAAAQGRRIPNATVTAEQVPLGEVKDQGQVVGKAGVYVDGETPSLRTLQVGRFELAPGASPHPPHTHAEEELLIVTRGRGEVQVKDTRVPARPGAVMYVDPQVSHGIKNTGDRPLEFYWIKYLPREK